MTGIEGASLERYQAVDKPVIPPPRKIKRWKEKSIFVSLPLLVGTYAGGVNRELRLTRLCRSTRCGGGAAGGVDDGYARNAGRRWGRERRA